MKLVSSLHLTAILALSLVADQHANGNADEVALTLGEAVQAAIERNPELVRARELMEEKRALAHSSSRARFPTLTAIGTATHKKDAVNGGGGAFGGDPYNDYSVLFRANYPIYRGGALRAEAASADHDFKAREADYELLKRDLLLDVLTAYLTILHEQERLKIHQSQKALQEQILLVARQREKIGKSQRLDVLQIQTQLALADPLVTQARNSLELAAARLARLIADRTSARITVRGALRPPSEDWIRSIADRGAAHGISSSTLPEVTRAEAEREQTHYEAIADVATHLPSADLLGTWGRDSTVRSELLDSFSTSWTLGVQLTFPLFSGLSSVSDRRAALAKREGADRELEAARDSIALGQVETEKNLQTARTVFAASEEAYRISRSLISEAQRSYRLSTVDYPQFLSVERDALQADLSYQQSKFDLTVATARWIAARGFALDAMIHRFDQELQGSSKDGSASDSVKTRGTE